MPRTGSSLRARHSSCSTSADHPDPPGTDGNVSQKLSLTGPIGVPIHAEIAPEPSQKSLLRVELADPEHRMGVPILEDVDRMAKPGLATPELPTQIIDGRVGEMSQFGQVQTGAPRLGSLLMPPDIEVPASTIHPLSGRARRVDGHGSDAGQGQEPADLDRSPRTRRRRSRPIVGRLPETERHSEHCRSTREMRRIGTLRDESSRALSQPALQSAAARLGRFIFRKRLEWTVDGCLPRQNPIWRILVNFDDSDRRNADFRSTRTGGTFGLMSEPLPTPRDRRTSAKQSHIQPANQSWVRNMPLKYC